MKHTQRLVFFVLAGFVFSACTTIRSDDTQLRRHAANLPILTLEEVGDRPYEIIGEVGGTSYAHDGEHEYFPPSVEAARQELRIDGAVLGADAFINSFCEEGRKWRVDVWGTRVIQCYADAIRWENRASAE